MRNRVAPGVVAAAFVLVAFAAAYWAAPDTVSIDTWPALLAVVVATATCAAQLARLVRAPEEDTGYEMLKLPVAMIALAAAWLLWWGSVGRDPSVWQEGVAVVAIAIGLALGLYLASPQGSTSVRGAIDRLRC